MDTEEKKPEAEAAVTPPVNEEEACNTRAALETPKEEEAEEEKTEGSVYAKFAEDLASLTARMTNLQASLETLTSKVSEMTAAREADRLAGRRMALKPWLTDSEWQLQANTIQAMDDGAFQLYQSSLAAKPLSFVNTVRLPEPVIGGTKEPLSLRK